MPTDSRDPETHEVVIDEASVIYCFDFSDEPVVAAGETIATPSVRITNGQALVTLGSPAVLSAEFTEIGKNGITGDSVASGKGVKVAVTPVSKGFCTVTCKVVASGGSTVARQVIFRVR